MPKELNLTELKSKLEKELSEVAGELSKVGRPNPEHPQDWEVTPAPNGEPEFRDEVADRLEEMEERTETELVFESRRQELVAALERLKAGTYGRCTICQEQIEPERLEANPAAITCKKHAL